jgi:hypothetical protein
MPSDKTEPPPGTEGNWVPCLLGILFLLAACIFVFVVCANTFKGLKGPLH